MRRAILVLAVITFGAAVDGMAAAEVAGNIRLAQTSAVTTCMMTCNAQAANCQAICLVPGTPPTNAATTTGNANVSTSCQLNCSTQQLACQTTCARSSPSP